MGERMHVLLTTEGTYPYFQGGVSTWCDMLLRRMPEVEFTVMSVIADPFVTQKFQVRSDARLLSVPLWGTEDPHEYSQTPFSSAYLSKLRTSDDVIKEKFVPLFLQLVEELISNRKNPAHFAETLLQLYQYFREYDYKVSFKSQATWEAYRQTILTHVENHKEWKAPDVYSLIQSLGWIYRFFHVLQVPVPKTHVSHSSAAAFCGIPCVVAKKLHGTPFLLTEHGVYLREQYIALAKRGYPSFLSTFLIRMIHAVVSVNYAMADQISPVCDYNVRWESRFIQDRQKLEVIYNGVDPNVFARTVQSKPSKLTVVAVARIDPIKDIETFLRAARMVHDRFPDVEFVVYGSVSVPEYYEQCVALQKELRMEGYFRFAGHLSNVIMAYENSSIIVQSSISEAFPYAVIEAMMTGRPVVATDVGGVSEALGDTGILVSPRDPEALANGIMRLVADESLRAILGREAKDRALSKFTLDQAMTKYLKSYIKLSVRAHMNQRFRAPRRMVSATGRARRSVASQRLYAERGTLLMATGYFEEAAKQFKQGIVADPSSVATPVLLAEMCRAQVLAGKSAQAANEREKLLLLLKLGSQRTG